MTTLKDGETTDDNRERREYGGATQWRKCCVCGLTADAMVVVETSTRCADVHRCKAVLTGQPLGPQWNVVDPVRFDLLPSEEALVREAVQAWQTTNLFEEDL